jgi:hypothetical protein
VDRRALPSVLDIPAGHLAQRRSPIQPPLGLQVPDRSNLPAGAGTAGTGASLDQVSRVGNAQNLQVTRRGPEIW